MVSTYFSSIRVYQRFTFLLVLFCLSPRVKIKAFSGDILSEHYLTACLYLNPAILQKLAQQAEVSDKEEIERAIEVIKIGQEIPGKALDTLLQRLPIIDESEGEDPSALLSSLRDHFEVSRPITYIEHLSLQDELMKEKILLDTSIQEKNIITWDPKEKESTPNALLRSQLKKQRKAVKKVIYVPFKKIFNIRFSHRSQIDLDKFIQCLIVYLRIERPLSRLYFTKSRRDLAKEIKEQEAQYDQVMEAIWEQSNQLNIPKEKVEHLLWEGNKLRYNPKSKELEICVRSLKKSILKLPQTELLIEIIPPKEQPAHKEVDAPSLVSLSGYAHLELPDYDQREIIGFSLQSYLLLIKDSPTSPPSYEVYYRLYHRDKKSYRYYRYSQKGVERIRRKTFFSKILSPQTVVLNYKKTSTKPLTTSLSWWSAQSAQDPTNIVIGGLLILLAYYSSKSKPQLENFTSPFSFLEPRQLSTAGLFNLTNTCFLNAILQIIIDHYPELITQTGYQEIDQCGNRLIQERNQGFNGEGVHRATVRNFRSAVYKVLQNKKSPLSSLYNEYKQQDASEAFIALESLREEKKEEMPLREVSIQQEKAPSIPLDENINLDLKSKLKISSCASWELSFPKNNNQAQPITLDKLREKYEEKEDLEIFGIDLNEFLVDRCHLIGKKGAIDDLYVQIKKYLLDQAQTYYENLYKEQSKDFLRYNIKGSRAINLSNINLKNISKKEITSITTQLRKEDKYVQYAKIIENLVNIYTAIGEFSLKDIPTINDICKSMQKVGFNIMEDELVNILIKNLPGEKGHDLRLHASCTDVMLRLLATNQLQMGVTEATQSFRIVAKRFIKNDQDSTSSEEKGNVKDNRRLSPSQYIELPIVDKKQQSGISKNKIQFALVGVVLHGGKTRNSGHYTAYSRHPTKQQWYHYNDQEVTEVSLKKVLEPGDGYIFYYRKEDEVEVAN